MRERRFGEDGRRGPAHLPGRTKEHASSPGRRARDGDYSSPRRARDREYSPRRRIRDSSRTRDYSSPPTRYQYSPVGTIRYCDGSPPVRSQNTRTRNMEISPPPTRTRNWVQRAPSGRSNARQLSPSGQQPRGEYFHELERLRRMEFDGCGDFGELQNAQPSHVGGDRDYGPARDRGNVIMFAQHSHKESLRNEDSTSVKYTCSHLFRNFDIKSSSDYGISGSRVSSERENHARLYPGLVDGTVSLEADGTVSLEADKRRLSSSYEPHLSDVGIEPRFSNVGNSDGYSLPTHYLDSDHLKDQEIHLEDGLHSHKAAGGRPVSGDLGMEDALKSMRYSEFSSGYMISSPHSKVFPLAPGVIKGDIASSYVKEVQIRSHGGRLNGGKNIESVGHGGYDKNPGKISSLNPEKEESEFRDYSGSYLGRAEGVSGTYNYSDIQRGEVGNSHTLSGESYGKRVGSGEAHIQDGARTNVGLARFDEFSRRETLVEDRRWGSFLSSQRRSMLDYFESCRALEQRNPDVDRLDYGAKRLPGFQMDDGLLEKSDVLYREQDAHLRERFISRDLSGPSNLSLREKNGTTNNRTVGIMISSDGRSAHKIHIRRDADEMRIIRDTGSVVMSRKLNVTRSKNGRNGRSYKAAANSSSSRSLSVSLSSRSSILSKSGGRDIKRRLGPRYQSLDIEDPLRKKYRPSLEKRLGPRLSMNHPPQWVNKFNSHKSRNQDVLKEGVAEQGNGPNEGNVTPAKTEPAENSKDFKKLVENAFFRFVKHLNETPAKRRKYIEQAGSLKCLVCGRDSEEFVDSVSVALHALETPKAGLRSQHLGLHKALCALMGWKSAADAPNNSWFCEMLSDDETVSLKEDLIIWPPVVIIHNSTIMDSNPDHRVVVSSEELESKLRDMGFGEKAKVSRGKPANHSILTVKFSGTLTGLQEAERLCDMYVHKKHGRAEFQQIRSGHSGSRDDETKEPSTETVGNIFYGYLGIAEDLDKLDFQTKKRSAVRSKKRIKDIAVAP